MSCFYYYKTRNTNFIDPIPACAGMTGGEYAQTMTYPNAHRHTGPRANIVCVGGSDGGVSSFTMTGGGQRVQEYALSPHCHREQSVAIQ